MIRFAEGTGDFTPLKRVQIASGFHSLIRLAPAEFPLWQSDPVMKLLYPPSSAEVEDTWCHNSKQSATSSDTDRTYSGESYYSGKQV